jgi:Alkylmercury lyase
LDDSLLWLARAYIYERFAATARAGTAAEIAQHFGLRLGEADSLLQALHARHALFLEPGTSRIRMANPFSAIETRYAVLVAGQTYWANCAWDTFGIAAALHADEAEIRSVCTFTGAPLVLRLAGGAVESSETVAHFLVPFQDWYDDLVHT